MKRMLKRLYAGTVSSLFAGITTGMVSTAIFLPILIWMEGMPPSDAWFVFPATGGIFTLAGLLGAFFWLFPWAALLSIKDRIPPTSGIFSLQTLMTVLVYAVLGAFLMPKIGNFQPEIVLLASTLIGAVTGSAVFSWWYPRLSEDKMVKAAPVKNGDASLGYVTEVEFNRESDPFSVLNQ
ncbi:MAG: hypothetical protein H6581_27000 [Bacteroidia bacterium]|nr:hypothetical protein [Bacteroidia bacterium]